MVSLTGLDLSPASAESVHGHQTQPYIMNVTEFIKRNKKWAKVSTATHIRDDRSEHKYLIHHKDYTSLLWINRVVISQKHTD